jgi:hypothetical protein
MDLDQIGPRFNLEMAANTESAPMGGSGLETRPMADAGDAAIGADQPPSADYAVIGFETVGGNSTDSDTPAQIDAKGFGASPECAVQLRTTNAEAWSTGENPLGRQFIVEVSDAAERTRAHRLKPSTVQYDHLEAFEAGRDGGGQPCRPPTHNDDVGVISHDPSVARLGP